MQRIHRVLMTTDTIGGVWQYALELAEALASRGVDVALAAMGRPCDESQRRAARRSPRVRLFEGPFKLEWMDEPWADVAAAGDWLLGLARSERPDIVHLNGYAHSGLPWEAPVLVVGHSCVFSWFRAVRGADPPSSWDRYRREVAAGLAAADGVTAPTRDMLAALRRHYGRFRARRAVPNGRRPAGFPPLAKEDFIVTAGRLWDEAKNITALEEIAADLDWPVFVAGDPQNPNANGGRVSLRRTVPLGILSPDELADWFGRASVFALPARYEPFGLSALEAALAGCALVLGDIPSLREVWGPAAVYVPPRRPDLLRLALERMIADRPGRERMARRARTRALRYTPERMAEGYAALYGSLIRRAGARSARTAAPAVPSREGGES